MNNVDPEICNSSVKKVKNHIILLKKYCFNLIYTFGKSFVVCLLYICFTMHIDQFVMGQCSPCQHLPHSQQTVAEELQQGAGMCCGLHTAGWILCTLLIYMYIYLCTIWLYLSTSTPVCVCVCVDGCVFC